MPRLVNPALEAFAQRYALTGVLSLAMKDADIKLRASGYAMLGRDDIQARVQELLTQRFAKANITADRTLKELARIAFSTASDLYTDSGELIPMHELPDDVAATITRISVEVTGRGDGANRALVTTKTIHRADKMAALALLSRHFKIVGEETDGVNALANALADRLKNARARDNAQASDARIVDPAALPNLSAEQSGMRLEYGMPNDPSNGADVSTPKMFVPTRDPQALHSPIPAPEFAPRLPDKPKAPKSVKSPRGTPHADQLW